MENLKCCGNCIKWFGYSYCSEHSKLILDRYGVCKKWEGDCLTVEQRLKVTAESES